MQAETANRELKEIAEENERRLEERRNREEEGEMVARDMAEMLNLGEIGTEYEIVEPIGEAEQQRRVYRLTRFQAPRPPLPPSGGRISEWCAWNQSRKLMVTEWRFEHTLGRAQKGKELLPPRIAHFEKRLNNATQGAVGTLASLKRVFDQQQRLLVQYEFVKIKKLAMLPTNINCHVLVGHLIDFAEEKCLGNGETFAYVREHFVSPRKRIA